MSNRLKYIEFSDLKIGDKVTRFLVDMPHTVRAVTKTSACIQNDCDENLIEITKSALYVPPLCIVEGKAVYAGDTLYRKGGGIWGESVTAFRNGMVECSEFHTQYNTWEGSDTGMYAANLTWEKPKQKVTITFLGYKTPTGEYKMVESPQTGYSNWTRVPELDVTKTIEE